jgi:hypothetical protein
MFKIVSDVPYFVTILSYPAIMLIPLEILKIITNATFAVFVIN